MRGERRGGERKKEKVRGKRRMCILSYGRERKGGRAVTYLHTLRSSPRPYSTFSTSFSSYSTPVLLSSTPFPIIFSQLYFLTYTFSLIFLFLYISSNTSCSYFNCSFLIFISPYFSFFDPFLALFFCQYIPFLL